jgi:CDP-glucose 4,6-dehydratase
MIDLKKTYNGKTVLITGHTGFKGAWLTLWLTQLGAKVIGVSNYIPTSPSHFEAAELNKKIADYRVDLRDKFGLLKIVQAERPDFVFHLAAQAIVRKSYLDPSETWETNVIGTLNILDCLRELPKKCIAIIITSDKCYDNVEWVWGYRETDALGGPDPYSASKGAAELVIKSHVKSFFSGDDNQILIASARAGNVIGGGDWATDRVIPDCVRAWSVGHEVELRSPNATRPWQHVLEPLCGYLTLAVALENKPNLHGESFNFGPKDLRDNSVIDLVSEMSKHWKMVKWKDVSSEYNGPHESVLLKLNCDKSNYHLGWQAVLNFEETVELTASWYKAYYSKVKSIFSISSDQIEFFTNKAMSVINNEKIF